MAASTRAATAAGPVMNSNVRNAIARIEIRDAKGKVRSRGTGTLVTETLVLTALHVVANRRSKTLAPLPGTMVLCFPEHECTGTIEPLAWDRRADWALVRCPAPVPARPVPLAELPVEPTRAGTEAPEPAKPGWECYGFPAANPQGMLFEGHVAHVDSEYQGISAMQLYSIQAAAGDGAPVPGLSGGPVLVDGALVGVMRSSLMHETRNVAGTLYACPVATVLADTERDDAVAELPHPDPIRGLPGLPRHPLPAEPFRFLEWFDERHAEVFFGRNREIADLYHRLSDSDHEPVLLFYGPTGVGKSSLLAAGLLPRLRRHHNVLYLRRDPDVGLLGTLARALTDDPDKDLRQAWLDREQDGDTPGRPLIVFLDQVEESFTRPHPDQPDELAALLSRIHQLFAGRSDGPDARTDDQADAQAGDQAGDRPGAQLVRPRGRLVLSFRKEWLPEIEERATERDVSFGKLFLEPIGRAGILEVCTGLTRSPRLQRKYNLDIEDGLAHMILADLDRDRDASIAPMLQVLLTKLWRRARERSESAPRMSIDDYRILNEEGVLLADFLEQQLAALPEPVRPDVRSGLVLDILGFHTTDHETANTRSQAEVQTAYEHASERLTTILDALKARYLLTDSVADVRTERKATQLVHDIMAPLVRERLNHSDAPGQRAQRILDNRSAEWRDGATGTPLDRRDLRVVEAGQTGMRSLSADERRLIAASVERRRRERLLAVILAAVLLVAAGLSIGLYRAGQRADERRRAAELQRQREAAAFTEQRAAQLQAEHARQRRELARLHVTNGVSARDLADDQVRASLHFATTAELSSEPSGQASWRLATRLVSEPYRLTSLLQSSAPIRAGQFSADGSRLVTWHSYFAEQNLSVFNPTTGASVTVLPDTAERAAISADGRRLVAWSDDTARVWDIERGTQIASVSHPGAQADSAVRRPVAIAEAVFTSVAADRLFTWAVGDTSARIWDLTSQESVATLTHASAIRGSGISSDLRHVVTWTKGRGTGAGVATVWATDSGQKIAELDAGRPVSGAAFAAGRGEQVLTWGDDEARIWLVAEPAAPRAVLTHGERITRARSNLDHTQVATWNHRAMQIWNLAGPQPSKREISGLSGVVDVHLGPSNNLALTLNGINVAHIWDLDSQQPMQRWTDTERAHFVGGAGRRVMTVRTNGEACIWDAAFEAPVTRLPAASSRAVTNARLSADRTQLLSRSQNVIRTWAINAQATPVLELTVPDVQGAVFTQDRGQIARIVAWSGPLFEPSRPGIAHIFDAHSGLALTRPLVHGTQVAGAAASPDGQRLVTWSGPQVSDGWVQVWDARTGAPMTQPLTSDDLVIGAMFLGDGEQLLSWGGQLAGQGRAQVWDINDQKPALQAMVHDNLVHGAIVDRDARRIVTWSGPIEGSGVARIWNAPDATPLNVLGRHNRAIIGAEFSPDQERVLTWSVDRTARVWSTNGDGELVQAMQHKWVVSGAEFSKNGHLIVTSSGKSARLWDSASGAALGPLWQHSETVAAVAFIRDGTRVLVWSHDGSVTHWPLPRADTWPTDRLVLRRQVETGARLSEHGHLEPITRKPWLVLKRQYDAILADLPVQEQ